MNPLRGKVPSRRNSPRRRPKTNWALHKLDLSEDFNNHCGYCDSYDGFRHTFFEVDHFVPKDLILSNGWPITLVQYSNLVYSCKFCNNNKLAFWPSNSYTRFHFRNKGFVDPCNANYDSHFYRTKSGEIKWRTPLGKWMYFNAFKFDQRNPGLKLLWNLNRIRKALLLLENEKLNYNATSRKYKQIQQQISLLSVEYVPVHRELINYYRDI